MRYSISLVVLLLFLGVFAESAYACTCVGPPMPCDAFGSADAVFVGTATSMLGSKQRDSKEVDWTPRSFKFTVEQSYSGIDGTEVEVFTGRGGGDCGYSFKIGERYLVYAYRHENKLRTSICSRTRPFAQASEDLEFLGNLSSLPAGATISGQIVRDEPAKKGESLNDQFVVRIEGADVRREVRPDADGRYRVTGLPPGKFKVTLELPEVFTTHQREREIKVSDRGCAQAVFYLSENGRLSGRVVDEHGIVVPRILVSVIDPSTDPKEKYVTIDRTDEEGRFNFSSLQAGKYLLGVNFSHYPELNDSTNAYPPTFYPGVADQPSAEVITLGVGEKRTGLEIRVPLPRPSSVLKGQIVWQDGSPVTGASLSVIDQTLSRTNTRNGVDVDQNGAFTINGYVGQKLVLQANSNRPYVANAQNQPMERSEPVRVTLERATQTVKVVITKLR